MDFVFKAGIAHFEQIGVLQHCKLLRATSEDFKHDVVFNNTHMGTHCK